MKFYERDTESRLRLLAAEGSLATQDLELLSDCAALPRAVAEHLIENQIGVFPVPLGLAEHMLVDGHAYRVPMATEEPSVIAAVSNAAQRVARSGGFHTQVLREGIPAQIVFLDHSHTREDVQATQMQEFLAARQDTITCVADDAHPTLRSHGGGLRSVTAQAHDGFLEFDLLIDPGEAMGANIVNTIAQAVARYLGSQLPGHEPLMAILSNATAQQRVRASAEITMQSLATSDMSGETVARRIVEAARFAQCSGLRAATHNKGVMNGINAVVLATGNDTRNVSAAAYADLDDSRRTWTTWTIRTEGRKPGLLRGTIDIPLPIGSVGAAISTLPMAGLAMRLLGQPSASQLMGIMASVGLASNLSAMRALVTRGIQAGHMKLQLSSLAMMAGAQGRELDDLTAALRHNPAQANLTEARRLLTQLRADGE